MKEQKNKTKKEIQIKNWQKENKKAIKKYNKRVFKNGFFSDGSRFF